MQLAKFFVKSALWIVIGLIGISVGYTYILLSSELDVQNFSDLYVHHSDHDSVSLSSQIRYSEKLLVVYFHPECEFCRFEISGLQKVDATDLTVDLVSFASKDSISNFLDSLSFANLAEVNVVYDSLFCWKDALHALSIPTTFYFCEGRLARKRSGFFKLENILYEE